MRRDLRLILISTTIILSLNRSEAQRSGDWTVGVTYQPFLYWKYNKSDWNNKPISYPVSPKNFNGWAGGLTATRYMNEHWGLGAELTFSRQRQSYNTLAYTIKHLDQSVSYHYAKGCTIKLDYLKLPVYAFLSQEIGYESGFYVTVMGGVQLAYNTDYYQKYLQFEPDVENKSVFIDSITNTIIYKPKYFFQDLVRPDGSHYIHSDVTEYLYRHFELSALVGIELEKRIVGNCKFSLGLRYEHGLTDIENPKVDKSDLTFGGDIGSDGLPDPRPPTYNRRLMLNIGLSKIIE